jgi:hypothetical protein
MQERFPDHKPLLPPAGSAAAARADALLRLERRLFGDWLGWLCQGWCAAAPRERQALLYYNACLTVTPVQT